MKRFVAVLVCLSSEGLASWVLLLAFCLSLGSSMAIAQEDDRFGPSPLASKHVDEKPSFGEETNLAPPSVPQIWADDDYDHDANALISKKLFLDLTSAGLNFQDTPLEEVIEFLRDEYELNIHVDDQGLDDLGLGPDEPITVNLKNIKLGAALRFMLKPLELTTITKDGILIFTSEDESLTQLKIAVYPVADLLSPKDRTATELIDIIVSSISSDTWAENGGGEAEIRFHSQRGSLVISQMENVHCEIVALLNVLRSCERCHSCLPVKEEKKIPYPLPGSNAF